jgi:hypothetical protein
VELVLGVDAGAAVPAGVLHALVDVVLAEVATEIKDFFSIKATNLRT